MVEQERGIKEVTVVNTDTVVKTKSSAAEKGRWCLVGQGRRNCASGGNGDEASIPVIKRLNCHALLLTIGMTK